MEFQRLHYENKKRMDKVCVRDAQYRAFRMTALCLALMCFLQATLNIVLRLHSTPCNNHVLPNDTENLKNKLFYTAEDPRMPGWVFRSSLYYMSTETKNWTVSRDDCASRNATLVIITSREEQDFIEMLRRGKSAWIGLSDRETEGVWKWVDGTALNTPFWWTGEPSRSNGIEHCVETGYNPGDGRKVKDVLSTWNDNDCNVKMSWICEKSIFV